MKPDQDGGRGLSAGVFCVLAISYAHYLVRLYHHGTRQLSLSLLVRKLRLKGGKVTAQDHKTAKR